MSANRTVLVDWLITKPGAATSALMAYIEGWPGYTEGERAAFHTAYRTALHMMLAAPEFAGAFAQALQAEEAAELVLHTTVEELTADARGEAALLAAMWAKEQACPERSEWEAEG